MVSPDPQTRFQVCDLSTTFPSSPAIILSSCVLWRQTTRIEPLNWLPHILKFQNYLPVCDLICLDKSDTSKSILHHLLWCYGFSPVWVPMWTVMLPFWLKAFPHVLQVNGFSPVWVRICIFSPDLLKNLFPQVLQRYSFSPVWVLMWIVKWPLEL